MLLSEHVYCVAVPFKMTEWAEQWICIKFCVKLEHSSTKTIQMIQKAAAMGKWWMAASSQQHARSCITSHAEFLVKHQITQVTQPHNSPDLEPCDFWLFPKTKITFEREEISHCQWDSRKYVGAADGKWENCVRSQGAYFEGDWGIIVLLQCFLYLVSSSINVSIFHITWLPSGQTSYVCSQMLLSSGSQSSILGTGTSVSGVNLQGMQILRPHLTLDTLGSSSCH